MTNVDRKILQTNTFTYDTMHDSEFDYKHKWTFFNLLLHVYTCARSQWLPYEANK